MSDQLTMFKGTIINLAAGEDLNYFYQKDVLLKKIFVAKAKQFSMRLCSADKHLLIDKHDALV